MSAEKNTNWLHSPSARLTLETLRGEQRREVRVPTVNRESVRRNLEPEFEVPAPIAELSSSHEKSPSYLLDNQILEITDEANISGRISQATSVDSDYQISDDDSDSSFNTPLRDHEHVITEREFSFEDLDNSLTEACREGNMTDRENNQARREPSLEDRFAALEEENRKLRTALEQSRRETALREPLDETLEYPRGSISLKEARKLIPYFDGNRGEVKTFLRTCTHAFNGVALEEERTLLADVLNTRLRGQALTELEHKRFRTYAEFKEEIQTLYGTQKSEALLQTEFNAIRMRPHETARAYGARVERIANDLMEVETVHAQTEYEGEAIKKLIRRQALTNFINGLPTQLKIYVKPRNHQTLQAAIDGAAEEERQEVGQSRQPWRQPSHERNNRGTYLGRNAANPRASVAPRRDSLPPPLCFKCNRTGHWARDCRTSQPQGRHGNSNQRHSQPLNQIQKYCSYCKRGGHAREECRRRQNPRGNRKPENSAGTTTSRQSNEDTAQIKATNASQLNCLKDFAPLHTVFVPIKESKQGSVRMLLDTGAAISLVKARELHGDTQVLLDVTTLTVANGEKIKTLGKFNATININGKDIKHLIHVISNKIDMKYDGILGKDFLTAQQAEISYKTEQLHLGQDTWHLISELDDIKLAPRSETTIRALTDTNGTGLIEHQELKPGVILGNCLVNATNQQCIVNIINLNETAVYIPTPQVSMSAYQANADAARSHNTPDYRNPRPSRLTRIKQLIEVGHLNNEEKRSLFEICENYQDTFHLEGEPLSCTNATTHKIAIQEKTEPINVRPYRLPEKHKMEVNRQVNDMIKDKIIQPSQSQWNAPLVVVPKKPDATGQPRLRIVVDFRKLNEVTIGDSFPLPNITEILDQLGHAKYFTTLDLASGYHQIPMNDKDKQKTAFSTSHGHYEFNRMPFGLKNAPATFQRLMNSVLIGLQGIKCFVYLDDIVIHGASLYEHNKRLTEVLEKLRQHTLKLQPEKCRFLRKEVAYLGHVITEEGIKPDPSKIESVQKFPVPKRVKDIQSFLGLAGYYRRFIEHFSKIAKPLTILTSKACTFEWTMDQQNAFDTLKEKLTTAPLLIYPDFTKEFLLTTDASDIALGAILSQGTIGHDKPIAYASRSITKTERNYTTTEKELLAIVWAVKHFRPYLYGTKFTIVTDHKALLWLFNVKDPGSRLIRWRLKLEEYDYKIVHKAGKSNTNADALSRAVYHVTRNTTATNRADSADSGSDSNDDEQKHTYTEKEKRQILFEYHDAPLGGHQGIERTLQKIKQFHKWKGMKKDIRTYVTACASCQRNKLGKRNVAPLILTDTPSEPFEKCALDIVGPLTRTENDNIYILTFQDLLTRFSKAMPVPNQEAMTIAKTFVTNIICEYGIPKQILTDQGTNFLSDVFKNVCKLLRISKIRTTAYHPQTNGALERTHRTIAEYLRHYINESQTDWDEWIPYAMFAYNSTPHTATGYSPFELLYGKPPELPSTITASPQETYNYDDYAQGLRERLRYVNRIARENTKQAKEKAKVNYDKRAIGVNFKIGDKVLLYDETLRRGRSKKLQNQWTGPYTILEKNSDVNYTIKKQRKTIRVHANRLKHFIDGTLA